MKKAVYPGSFDPVTEGHLDIIKRASKFIDQLIVVVGSNPNKNTLFSTEERVELIEENLQGLPNVKVDSCSGLLVEFLKERDINLIIRGLREISDFEDELQMALMNKKLAKDIETIMLVAKGKYNYLSSSLIKEVAQFDGCVEGIVPDNVEQKLKEKFNGQ